MELNTANLLDYLAEFACNLKYEDLPEEVVREAKRRIFDSLGCLIMGARHDEAVKLVRHGMAGKEWQTIFNADFAVRFLCGKKAGIMSYILRSLLLWRPGKL